MTTPTDDGHLDDGQDDDPGTVPDPAPRTVLVPFRLGDGISTHDEYVRATPETADQWDARLWHDKPPL